MSKVATYLREHILGEISSHPNVVESFTADGSVLEIKPEMVAYPRVTNDIRKLARFSWQLAEKGHVLPITARGAGGDQTGAAIGRGMIIDTSRHMNQVYEYDGKQRLVRLQPGASVEAVSAALGLSGAGIPPIQDLDPRATLGGVIASGHYGANGDKYGDISEWISQLEVVLASGEVIQTGRIAKRELNRRKGLQTMEGEIYRGVDNLIDDNAELLAEMADDDTPDAAGYARLARVRRKDGSFDLTPLFVGSQGTLGIISEMILQTEFVSFHEAVAVMVFKEKTAARDATATLRKLQPATAEYYDGDIFELAAKSGRTYAWLSKEKDPVGAVIVVGFDEMNAKVRQKKLKKLEKEFTNTEGLHITAAHEDDEVAKLAAVRDVLRTVYDTSVRGEVWPALLDDFYVPENRLEEFTDAFDKLAKKYNTTFMLHGHVLTGVYSCRLPLHLGRTGDRQKVFKLLDEFAKVLNHHDGVLVASSGDGRLKAKFALAQYDDKTRELYASLRKIFDPHGTLNPGVKQDLDMRELAKLIKNR